VWDSVKNRWAWLAVNLVTAFIASRVIGAFEAPSKLVALAALMPIVAGIGGNSGNQTITMIVRGIAMGQAGRCPHPPPQEGDGRGPDQRHRGRPAWRAVVVLYGSGKLGAVMTAAMTLNLLLAASGGDGPDDPQPPGAGPGGRLQRHHHRRHRLGRLSSFWGWRPSS
jgi:magnesium transporter